MAGPRWIETPKPSPTATRLGRTYGYNLTTAPRWATVKIDGTSAPSGYDRRVEFDEAGRLTRSQDAAGFATTYEWDPRDWLLATTDPGGRRSTTIYNQRHGWVSATWGPAPQSCYPNGGLVPSNCANVPSATTAYDESHAGGAALAGLAVEWFANSTLSGAPVLHNTMTGVGGFLNYGWGAASPVPGTVPPDGFSGRWTGDITFPAVGTYVVKLFQDDGVRLFIDDKIVVDSWVAASGWSAAGTVTTTAPNETRRIRIDHYEGVGNAGLALYWDRPDNPPGDELVPVSLLSPAYGLVTTSTVLDGSPGSPGSVSRTTYFADGALGLADTVTLNPGGGDSEITTRSIYESYTVGSAQGRRLSRRVMPSGSEWVYGYWGNSQVATAADSSCAGAVGANQAGRLKSKVHPGGLSESFSYDAAGRQVGYRKNSDPWTCTTFNARGQVQSVAYPAISGFAGGARTVSYTTGLAADNGVHGFRTWRTTMSDGSLAVQCGPTPPAGCGVIVAESDWTGRPVGYFDGFTQSTFSYDAAGRLVTTNSGNGAVVRVQDYDVVGRPWKTSLNSVLLSTSTYSSSTGELAQVSYGNGTSLDQIVRDDQGRTKKLVWRKGLALLASDEVGSYSRSGRVLSTSASTGASTVGSNFEYDAAGRLTKAVVGSQTWTYGFGVSGCASPGVAAAGKNSNRTSISGPLGSFTYCYNNADQVIGSTDPELGAAAPAVSYAGGSSVVSTTAQSSVSLVLPAGVVAGDVIVVGVQSPNGSVLGAVSGYSVVSTQVPSVVSRPRLTLLRRVAGGGEVSVSIPTGGVVLSAVVGVYRGADSAVPLGAVVAASADGSSVVVPSVAASVPGSMLAVFGAAANAGPVASWSMPAGLTKRVEASTVGGGGGEVSVPYRAVNFNGAQVVANGVTFEAQASAVNHSTNGADTLCLGGSVPVLSPPPGAEAQLLPCFIYSWNNGGTSSTFSNVPAGTYDVWVWEIEDNSAVVHDLKLNNVTVATALSSGAAGQWAKRGPYRTTLTAPGTIKLQATVSNGAVAFAAIQVNRVTTTTTGTSTATVHASRPVAAGATGTSTLAFGASAGLTALGVVLNPSPATGALLSYDAHGNTTQIGARVLGWDAADRNVSMTRAGVTTTWTRDATGRIRGRELSGATVEQWRPGFDGDGDSPAFTRSATGAIGEIYQPLPGGVMFFKRIAPVVTEGDRWSYPNIHGDTLVTTDATGAAVTGLLTYSPDGRPLSGAAGNVVGSADYGWLGSHSRPAEDGATIIQMGARPYLPAIGRFLSVDPVEAGTPNDYVYPADPVNQVDLTGQAWSKIAYSWNSVIIASGPYEYDGGLSHAVVVEAGRAVKITPHPPLPCWCQAATLSREYFNNSPGPSIYPGGEYRTPIGAKGIGNQKSDYFFMPGGGSGWALQVIPSILGGGDAGFDRNSDGGGNFLPNDFRNSIRLDIYVWVDDWMEWY